jgi:hypothetical protein
MSAGAGSTRSLAERLIGGWLLRSWEIVRADRAEVGLPFGPQPAGLITYTADGWMSATICGPDRPNLSQPSPRSVPAEELARAYTSYFSYAGRWRTEGDDVIHDVVFALNPGMSGTEQRRRCHFDGADALTLSADEADAKGNIRHHNIRWRRAG